MAEQERVTMTSIGCVLIILCAVGGVALAQFFFHTLNGRFLWRVVVPVEYRRKVVSSDQFHLDPFHHLEEWVAILFLGACLTMPLIVLDAMGFLPIFH
jgi:hypothetical protein